jgi:hypothetical protein
LWVTASSIERLLAKRGAELLKSPAAENGGAKVGHGSGGIVLLQTAIARQILDQKIAFDVNIGIDPMCQSPLQPRIETGRANKNLKT